MVVRAQGGERNRLRVSRRGAKVVVSDAAGARPGQGCRRGGGRVVTCRLEGFFATDMSISLGDRSDRAIVRGNVLISENGGGLRVNGGRGNDRVRVGFIGGTLRGGPGNDLLRSGGSASFFGGQGDDRMTGTGGSDSFVSEGSADGSDTISGGKGQDFVSYGPRRDTVRADLAGDRDDGARSERDRIATDIETLIGGRGDDLIVGNSMGNSLRPGPGADVARGGDGMDNLTGDEFSAADAGDRLIGGRGRDFILGSSGPDTIIGGPKLDTVTGGGGADRIELRDGGRDQVECGEGSDVLVLDAFDFFTDLISPCEEVQRDAPAGAVLTSASELYPSTSPDGRTAFVRVGCPGDAPSPCRGTVRFTTSDRSVGPVDFSIARNESAPVELALDERTSERVSGGGQIPITLVIETVQPGGGVSRVTIRTFLS